MQMAFGGSAMSSVQLQVLHIDVSLLSETHLKHMRDSLFEIITFILLIASQEEKCGAAIAVKKGIP
jgi:hypothetical protein